MLELEQFVILKTCEIWLGLINSCIYYTHQTTEIYQALPYSVDLKAHAKL